MVGNQKRRLIVGGTVVLVALVAAAVAVFIAGRGQRPTPAATPIRTTTSPSPTTTPLLTAPLTGLPVTPGMSLNHPAVAIKISDVRQAHPQIGVDKADIVFTEPIGVAYTRLLAVFHSQLPSLVGPVRS